MFWSRFFGAAPSPTASDAARLLADRAACRRAIDAIPIAERKARVTAALRRSGAKSPIRPRAEVVATVRAERIARQQKGSTR